MKRCARCQEAKPESEFSKARNRRDGLYAYCKVCHRAESHRYAVAHTAEIAAYGKEYRTTHGATISQKESTRYYANPEPKRTRERARRAADPVQNRAKVKAWRQENPLLVLVKKHERRAARLGVSGTFTPEEWLALCARYGNRCLCCGKTAALSVDHVVPLTNRQYPTLVQALQ